MQGRGGECKGSGEVWQIWLIGLIGPFIGDDTGEHLVDLIEL